MTNSQKMLHFNFIRWLAEKYIRLEKKTLPNPCKLIGVVRKNCKLFAQIQVAGQSHIVEIPPQKIVEDDLFEYFSTHDKKTLFSLVFCKEKLRLSEKYHCKNLEKEMVVLTDIATGDKMTILASDIASNTDLIEQINSKDANKIGFLSGIEYAKIIFGNQK